MLVRNRSLFVLDLETHESKDYVVELYCTSQLVNITSSGVWTCLVGNLTSRSQNDSKCRLLAINMLALIKGDDWHSEVTRMGEFDMQMSISLDSTEQSFTRLFKELFLRLLRLNNKTIS